MDRRADLLGYITLLDGMASDKRTLRSSQPNISPTISGRVIGEGYKRIKTNPNLQDEIIVQIEERVP